jgi:hypothetical protein
MVEKSTYPAPLERATEDESSLTAAANQVTDTSRITTLAGWLIDRQHLVYTALGQKVVRYKALIFKRVRSKTSSSSKTSRGASLSFRRMGIAWAIWKTALSAGRM